jgi:hypothetical protein
MLDPVAVSRPTAGKPSTAAQLKGSWRQSVRSSTTAEGVRIMQASIVAGRSRPEQVMGWVSEAYAAVQDVIVSAAEGCGWSWFP